MASPNQDSRPRDRFVLAVAAVAALAYFIYAWAPQPEGPPVETASASEIRAYFNENEGSFKANATLGAVAIAAGLVFTTCLARLIRRQEADSPLADLVVGGGVLLAVWQWFYLAVSNMTLVQVLDGTDLGTVNDSTLQGWYGMTNAAHAWGDLAMVPIVITMGAGSIAAIRLGVLPRWLGWLGATCSVAGGLGLLGITLAVSPLANAWFVGIFGWFIWVLLSGIVLGLRLRGSGKVKAVEGTRIQTPA